MTVTPSGQHPADASGPVCLSAAAAAVRAVERARPVGYRQRRDELAAPAVWVWALVIFAVPFVAALAIFIPRRRPARPAAQAAGPGRRRGLPCGAGLGRLDRRNQLMPSAPRLVPASADWAGRLSLSGRGRLVGRQGTGREGPSGGSSARSGRRLHRRRRGGRDSGSGTASAGYAAKFLPAPTTPARATTCTRRRRARPFSAELREFDLSVVETTLEVAGGQNMQGLGLWRQRYPVPIIRATVGEQIQIALTNRSEAAHSVHFHGAHDVDAGRPGAGRQPAAVRHARSKRARWDCIPIIATCHPTPGICARACTAP